MFNNIKKNYIEIREGIGQPGQRLFTPLKKHGRLGRDNKCSVL